MDCFRLRQGFGGQVVAEPVIGLRFRADPLALRNDGRCDHLFKKFSGNPGRDQSIAISSPLPDSVMYAVFRSGPPKAMLVVTRSPVGTCSTTVPSGAITEMQPEISVAT